MTDSPVYDLWIRSGNPRKIVYDADMHEVIRRVSSAKRDDVLSWGLLYWPRGEMGYRLVGQEILDLVDATRICGSGE